MKNLKKIKNKKKKRKNHILLRKADITFFLKMIYFFKIQNIITNNFKQILIVAYS